MLEESCPIEVFATELQRRIQEGTGDAQKDLQTLPCLNEEAPIAEAMARSKGMWVDLSEISCLGTPFPSGVENDVYLNPHGNVIYKVNNLMTSKTLLSHFFRIILIKDRVHSRGCVPWWGIFVLVRLLWGEWATAFFNKDSPCFILVSGGINCYNTRKRRLGLTGADLSMVISTFSK